MYRHGGAVGGESKLYMVYKTMKQRYGNPKSQAYPRRGIRIASEWNEFGAFLKWAEANGYKEGLQIDRIDNDGPYAPNNCQFVSNDVNSRNRHDTRQVTAFGETKTIQEWCRDPRSKVWQCAIRDRILSGIDPEIAITAEKISYKRSSICPGMKTSVASAGTA